MNGGLPAGAFNLPPGCTLGDIEGQQPQTRRRDPRRFSEPLRTGYTCECGQLHKFNEFIYGHWNCWVEMTCKTCGRAVYVMQGLPIAKEALDKASFLSHPKMQQPE
jgi:hypothetical protein